jgi:hypothetical protein
MIRSSRLRIRECAEFRRLSTVCRKIFAGLWVDRRVRIFSAWLAGPFTLSLAAFRGVSTRRLSPLQLGADSLFRVSSRICSNPILANRMMLTV